MQKQTRNIKTVTDKRYIRPKAANDLMKAAQGIRRTVYIYGVTGFGKTSFVADFLSRRRYEYYSMADTELFFQEHAQEKEETERIVVVDDLQLLTTSDDREKGCRILEGLAASTKVWLILISRSPLPAWLKPLFIRRVFAVIGEKELGLNGKEQEAYLAKWELSLMPESENKLLELSQGQPLFLRIEAIWLSALSRNNKSSEERRKEELAVIEAARRDWWDYLETSIYDQWNMELQEFLLDISIVERFDLQMAQLITKKNDAGRMIAQAQETGNFLLEHTEGSSTEWELRLPMKLSMRRRLLKRCAQTHIDSLYYSAGNCYELQNKIPEALAMYEKCHNEESITRLLTQNTRKSPGTGHYWELRNYYLALSEETIKKSPELIAGMSMLQSILLNDEESERWYQFLCEYAKTKTGSAKREAQARILYLDIGLPHRGTVQMTDILKNAWTLLTERKMLLPEFSVTNNQPSQMNGGKDFCEWSRRDRELAKSIGKVLEVMLGRFGKGLVNLALAESFFEKGGDNYEVSTLAGQGRLRAESGGKTEQVFVAVGILAWLSLFHNHPEDALELVESFRAAAAEHAPQLLQNIDALRTWFALYGGRSGEASEWLLTAADEDKEFCTLERYSYMVKVRVYLSMGKKERALRLLQRMIPYAKKRQRTYIQIEAGVLLAITKYRMGDKDWQEVLQNAIAQAESYHFVRVLTREGVALWELFKAGDFTWQDTAFKKQVLKECEHMAQTYPVYLSEKQEGNVLLSDKALKILRMQAQGQNVEQIAQALGLSRAGVKYYNQETYKKLGVSGKAAAITEARNRRMI